VSEDPGEGVLVAAEDGTCRITLSRPRQRNALSTQDRLTLRDALIRADADPAIRTIVITGAGDHFCAGGDVREFADRKDHSAAYAYALTIAQATFRAMRRMRTPTIARVRGVAAGAGMYLALGCDIVVADETASFHPAHLRLAVIPDWGAIWLLPRLVGLARAKAIALSGDSVPAATAAEWGLIADCVPESELDGAVQSYCAKIAAIAAVPVALTRVGLDGALDRSLSEFLEWEADAIADVMSRPEHHEQVSAFLAARSRRGH
jgi:2-(1,2-epoxy-1,2-dihydrophenyl)acetyl-CoA isomerase